ncbi:hypothetical protein [Planomonospora sphaerica]|uniref:hypothetical protein n=1 Tax=Planomonospora sphaerica TaxID=161355 RepID=UPI00083B32EC|nr:hypothetical protein [Planomonospora sphaerica]
MGADATSLSGRPAALPRGRDSAPGPVAEAPVACRSAEDASAGPGVSEGPRPAEGSSGSAEPGDDEAAAAGEAYGWA